MGFDTMLNHFNRLMGTLVYSSRVLIIIVNLFRAENSLELCEQQTFEVLAVLRAFNPSVN